MLVEHAGSLVPRHYKRETRRSRMRSY